MNTDFPRRSAKIYQFPIHGRESVDRRKPAQQAAGAYYLGKQVQISVSDAWYHDAAIKDDDRGRKG